MIDNSVLSSVFDSYKIQNIVMVEQEGTYNFLISNMPTSISLDRWEYLENILRDITKKEIVIMPMSYAKKHLNLEEGVVIK